MGKVIITIIDNVNTDGEEGVVITYDFDPPIDAKATNKDLPLSAFVASEMLKTLKDDYSGSIDFDHEGEDD